MGFEAAASPVIVGRCRGTWQNDPGRDDPFGTNASWKSQPDPGLGQKVDAGLERFDGSDDFNLSYGESTNGGEAKGEAFSEIDSPCDSELERLVSAWPKLPAQLRLQILELIWPK